MTLLKLAVVFAVACILYGHSPLLSVAFLAALLVLHVIWRAAGAIVLAVIAWRIYRGRSL
jgi:hypothetical protein